MLVNCLVVGFVSHFDNRCSIISGFSSHFPISFDIVFALYVAMTTVLRDGVVEAAEIGVCSETYFYWQHFVQICIHCIQVIQCCLQGMISLMIASDLEV